MLQSPNPCRAKSSSCLLSLGGAGGLARHERHKHKPLEGKQITARPCEKAPRRHISEFQRPRMVLVLHRRVRYPRLPGSRCLPTCRSTSTHNRASPHRHLHKCALFAWHPEKHEQQHAYIVTTWYGYNSLKGRCERHFHWCSTTAAISKRVSQAACR